MKSIFVTGGGGFLGSNLVAGLIGRGTHQVIVCDHFGTSEKWRNLGKHLPHDIIPPEQCFDWLNAHHQDIEMLFHLGSISSTVEKDIDLILKNNFIFSLSLWRWCGERGIRMLYSSSSATYGDGTRGFDDTMDLAYLRSLTPMSGYGWSKHLFDVHVANDLASGAVRIPQWVGLKFFNAYGPNEYHKEDQKSVIGKIAAQAVHGGRVHLFRSHNQQYADGEQKRDVIYVKDCVKVMLWMLDHPKVSGLYNLGTGKACSFNQMAAAIFTALGRKPNIHYTDMPETLALKYQYFTEAKIERLRAAGYDEPFTAHEAGIADYVQNYLAKPDIYL